MPSTAPAPETMRAEMCACAHRLGMAFGREAEQEVNWRRKLELVQLFNQCFFGVRVAIALKMRLTRPVAQPRAEAREAEDFHDRGDPSETGRLPRLDADRDRDVERATLPMLLKTLRGVAADAAALPGPPPAELQPLTTLLARATEARSTEVPAIRRPAAGALRSRLAGASALPLSTPPPRAGPLARGLAATGPPRR